MTLATVPAIDAELDALEQAVVEACAALVRAAETAHRRGADGTSNAARHNDLQPATVSANGDAALENHPSHPTNRDAHAADSLTDWDAESWYLPEDFAVPPHCIPVRADVRFAPWDAIASAAGGNYDAIVMDPPWQLATANPTRGVALGYQQLSDELILSLPIERLQRNGLLLIWVINAKYKTALDMFDRWGYQLVDELAWVKLTVHRRLAKNHGFYLQHAKETCLVGIKCASGWPSTVRRGVETDVIRSERRGQSQKPDELYEWVERVVPNGKYLEIFARKNNLRNFWVSLGNEVTGESFEKALPLAVRQQLLSQMENGDAAK